MFSWDSKTVLEIGPRLIQCQDESFAAGLRLLVLRLRGGSEPVGHRRGRDPQQERETVHGQAIQGEQPSADLRREGLASRGGTGTGVPTRCTEFLRLAGGRTVVAEAITLALTPSPLPDIGMPLRRGYHWVRDVDITTWLKPWKIHVAARKALDMVHPITYTHLHDATKCRYTRG